MKIERIADASVAALLLMAAVWTLLTSPGDADAYSRAVAVTRGSGYLALIALSCALCATPLARLTARLSGVFAAAPGEVAQGTASSSTRWTRRVRRAFGIAAASCAIAHASLAYTVVPGTSSELFSSALLRFGFGALLILVLLLATSFPRLVAELRVGYWTELHRLAYVAWPFALMHAWLAPFSSLLNLLWLAGVTLGIGLLRAIPLARSLK